MTRRFRRRRGVGLFAPRHLKGSPQAPKASAGAAMNSIASIALSGMSAASLRVGASAHNIANLQTPDFRRQLTLQEARPEGGVSVTFGRAAEAGDALAEDIVGQKIAGYAFKANLLTLQTHDRMLGSLLDLKA
jgi:hypothetical protein